MVQAMDSLCPVAVAYAETDNVTVPTTSACVVHCTLLSLDSLGQPA